MMTTWTDEWAPMVAAIGTDFGDGTVWRGGDAVERSLIRRYLEPLEFDCPLHHDDEVARRHGHRSIIAPATSVLMFMVPALWQPGDEPLFTDADRDAQPARTPTRNPSTGLEPPSTGYFATHVDLDVLRPLVLGDRVGRRGNRLVACTPKQTTVGRGAFTTWETDIVDQHTDVVARLRMGRFSYVPEPRPPTAPPHTGAPASTQSNEAPGPTASNVDWKRQRTWHDMHEGDRIEPVAFPLSAYRLVLEAGANRDFNSIHHNTEYAKATGAAEMYANTTFLLGMWERAAREFLGLGAVIHRIFDFRMRRFNYVGRTATVFGSVERKWIDGGAGWVSLRVWTDDGDGVTVGPGHIEASLPLAAGAGQ